MQIRNAQPPTFAHAAAGPRAFTLIEMMTAIGLLLLIIAGVGIIFKAATGSVSLSQANMEMMSNIRAVQGQIERDIGGLERNGFIVIRSREEPVTGGRRFDQLAFLANGSFPNRTGNNLSASPFTDRTTANSALIWYGHLMFEGTSSPPDQSTAVAINAIPTAASDNGYTLGRHATLLLAEDGGGTANRITAGGITVIAHDDIRLSSSPITSLITETSSAHISSARFSAATITSGQLMQSIVNAVGTRAVGTARYEADNYCYRFKTLPNPYANANEAGITAASKLTNAYFRMHPILLPGVPDFAVEWSDGTLWAATDTDPVTSATVVAERVNTPRWFGRSDPKYGTTPGTDPTEPALANGDDYTAQFSYDNRSKWPKALRIRYRVTDPNNRLSGGRDFTQIIKIPD